MLNSNKISQCLFLQYFYQIIATLGEHKRLKKILWTPDFWMVVYIDI